VGDRANQVLETYREVGTSVEARVDQTAAAISTFETATQEATATLESVRQASDAATQFLETEGRPLAAEARATLEAARRLTDAQIPGLIEQANTTLATVNREAIALSGEARTTMQSVTGAVNEATETLTAARVLTNDRIPGLIEQASTTLATVDREATALSGNISTMIQTATARLDDAQAIFDQISSAVGQAGQVMTSFQGTSGDIAALVRDQGQAFLADARVAAAQARDAISTISETIQADLPVLSEDLRTAAATANRVIADVGNDINTASAEFVSLSEVSKAALATAIDTFERSNETLEWINGAMASAEGTLQSAERAFNSVNRVIDEDIDVIVDDVRVAAGTFTAMVESVSQDVTSATAQVEQASASAANLVGTLETVVVSNRRQLSEFLRLGLPSVQQFVDEARRLTSSLDRLVTRLERDPARFLLGTNSSEFRR
jgi:phospholipid/cholesterol/gamma-HCH transport system substrate-binding protein